MVEVVDEEEEDPSAYPPEWREVKLQVCVCGGGGVGGVWAVLCFGIGWAAVCFWG